MEEKNVGKVVCVKANDKKKVKDNWFPGLIVAPTSQTSIRINVAEDYLVRSFKDGKYYTAPKKEITEFTKEIGARVENPTLKTAVEKALFFLDKDELPPHWNRDLLFGVDKICISPDSVEFHSNNSDEESIEEKDYFVAQLFKFMDDRRTPLNQAPTINEKDVDLYELFKAVNNCGGYNKVNKDELWKFVANKAGHDQQSFFSVKHCYQQYLHSYENFYRKLGCTMLSHPRGLRSRNKYSRSLIRNFDKVLPSTSSRTDIKKCVKKELNKKKKKVSAVTKKTATALKSEEKLLKNNEETSKKNDKKKEENANSISCNKLSMKWDSDLSDTKILVNNSKTKKEMKEIFKKGIDSDKEDDDQINEDTKLEKKIFTKNLFGKLVQETTNKEKVVKVKSVNTELSGMRKIRAIKRQVKTFVKEIIPLKKSKRGNSNAQQEALNKGNPIEEVPKLTRSKTKEDLPTKSGRLSVLNDLAGGASVVQLSKPGLFEYLVRTKKEDGFEKKITLKEKKNNKEEKAASNVIIPIPIGIENVPFDKHSLVIVGDNLVVYHEDKQATTYDAKVVDVCDIEGEMKYYVHYKGWNSLYDEWVDVTRIAYKKKEPEPVPELNIDADFSKSNPLEQKNLDPKKVPSTSNRTRKSVTPLPLNSNFKKTPYSSARPTRSCTLTDRPLLDIDNSDSEEEYTATIGPSKQYSKKNIIQSELGVIKKSEPLNTDNQNKTLYPKTYPSKEVIVHRNALKKPKTCEFNVHRIKSEKIKICDPTTLKPAYNFDFLMQLLNNSIKPNEANENLEVQNKNKIDNRKQIEPKIAQNHYQVVEQNGAMIPFVPNSHGFYSFNNNVELKDNNNLKIINIYADPIMKNQSDNESYESQTSLISDGTVVTSNIKEFQQHFQDEDNVSDLKYEVLDLSMKPPESPLANIFSIPEQNKFTDMILEEDDDNEESSNLVIAENDKLEIDYQIDSDLVISEEHYSFNVQIDKNIEAQSLPPLPPSIHSTIELECKNMDNIDENTKSGFGSNSKLPTIKNREIIESTTKLINEPLVNDKPKICYFKVHNFKDNYEKEKTMTLPELQCTEKFVDENTLNNSLVIEYKCKDTEYNINKLNTSRGFFDPIHQPGTDKDSFYETDTSYDAKNSLFKATQAVKSVTFNTNIPEKSSLFDPNIPSCSSNYFYDHNMPSTSKSSYYEYSLPSTSKSFYIAESDVSNVLFYEKTIPGSPTGTFKEQYDQEERRKALQGLSEESEAASAIYTMNQSFYRPMITLMGATEEKMKKYSNILQKDGTIFHQQYLQFLAEFSSRNLGINEPSVTVPFKRERETIVEKIISPPEKFQSKCRISSLEQPPKRNKLSTTTAPISSGVAISDNTNATVINENLSELNINLNTNADCSISTPVSIINMDEYKTAKLPNDIGLFVNCSESRG